MSITMFNNNLFSNATMSVIMSESKNRQALERLLEAAAIQGMNGPAALAKRLGETEQTITNWGTRGVSKRGAVKAQTELGISASWIMTGDGPKFISAQKGSGPENLDSYPVKPERFKRVWVVGKAAGGVIPERLWTDGDYPVGATDEYGDFLSSDPHAFLVAITGTSMVPRYNPGEYALVEPGTEPEIEDDVLVRCADGKTMIKRLLSKRNGYMFGSWNNNEIIHLNRDEVSWVYYVAYPVPRRKIKIRA